MTEQKQPTVSNPVEPVVIRYVRASENEPEKPIHEDIKKYGYELHQSKEHKRWYASYEEQKGTVWFMWCRDHFRQIEINQIPNDLVCGGV